MFEFFGCVASALAGVSGGAKYISDVLDGGRRIYGFAAGVIERISRILPSKEQPVVIHEALSQAASMPLPEFELKMHDVVDRAIPEQPVEVRKAITEYLTLMPARIRQTFSREEDPSGKTIPVNFTILREEDLFPLLPPRPPMFQEGDSPPEANRWLLVERLGIGGFGEVWKARSKTMQNSFSAFKFCLDPKSQQYFYENELRLVELVKNALTDHPHIVKVMDAYSEGPTPWIQYEYIPGGDLGQLVATWPKELSVRANLAVEMIGILAQTLADCHALKPEAIIHRDMKPANVLIGKNGTLKITDFGISQTQARQALEEAMRVTASGRTLSTPSGIRWANTPMYASPQQKRGQNPHPSDDVHALGVMLYQMLIGNLDTELGVDFERDLAEQHVCEPLLEILSRSVSSRSERRYQHAGELVEALKSLPKKLLVDSIAIRNADQEKVLYQEMDRCWEEAKTKNETARQYSDRREWKMARDLLESIFHPVMRDEELYSRVVAHLEGKRFINNLGMEFALVPKGTFWMGGKDGKCGNKQVTIEQDFYMGIYPVTQEEWQKVMDHNPSYFRRSWIFESLKLKGISDDDLKRFPVENVSWNDCQKFIYKLNENLKETGWLYRLPREAEWEYACRGGATSEADCSWNYYFQKPTNRLSSQQANFQDSSLERPTKVGSYGSNLLGIFDMHGNVWEWCEDVYNRDSRVRRGGSWKCDDELCYTSYRNGSCLVYYDAYADIGLRLVRVPVQ
jgi:formylglycine-generating enzyme required for sulfatase activity